ncbi:DUF2339 domain-containing protein [Pinisolibacter sp.]|uniref:DUF2339 domain-containing protein n=1 Tax=Pinisolibacter sp. TaxID=2172024 RepID=UPI002FDEE7C4
MDGLITLAIVLIIAVPAMALLALSLVLSLRGRVSVLEAELRSLAARTALASAVEAEPGVAPRPIETESPITAETADASETVTSSPDVAPVDEAEAVGPIGEPEPAVTPAASPNAPVPSAAGLEERIGTRWAVWVGGAALAFGLVFLVQYSIEQGFFGPAARLLLGAAASLAVIGAGEWLRRGDRAIGVLAGFPAAHIPAVLTAAGATGLFADVWAAYALYGFFGPALAFVALGAVALATMAAALVHGPWLGVLGILGAYGTPVLVHSDAPQPEALAGFLLVVTAAAFGVARIRLWRWVAATALALAVGWGVVFVDLFRPLALAEISLAVYALGVFLLTAGILVVSLDEAGPPTEDAGFDRFGLVSLAAATFLVLVAFDRGAGSLGPIVLVATLIGLAGLAWRIPVVAPAIVIAAVAAVLAAVIQGLDVAASLENDTFAIGTDGLVALRPRVIASFLGLHGAIGAGLVAIGFFGAWRATPQADRVSGWFALAGTGLPLLLLVVVWGRVASFEIHFGYAAVALAAAAGFTAACLRLIGRESAERPSLAVAIYAIAAIAALGTAAAIALERAALTVALAAMVPAIAWVWTLRPIDALRIATAVVGVVVLGRLGWDPAITRDIATTPIFNALLLGYGVPAAGTLFAARLFRTTPQDIWRAVVEGLALIFVGLLALVEIRHLTHGGDLFAPTIGLVELGLDVTTAFLLSAGAQRAAGRLGSPVIDATSKGLSLFTAAIAILGLVGAENPVITGRSVGPLVFGALFFGYLLPAIAAGVTARMARLAGRPWWLVAVLAGAAHLLGFVWVTLMVRRAFQGEILTGFESDAEMWAYSAAWLVYGVATLVVGLVLGSKPVRLLSGVVVTATAAKVFLIDLADVGGVWRAFSFIGLGVVLIGIALVYQRFLFARPGDGKGAS